jgi:trans-aconitate methyltransferase
MKLAEAQELIKPGLDQDQITKWMDLGCGSGLFTHALASLLVPGSYILAIDKMPYSMAFDHSDVMIDFMQADMESLNVKNKVDGILMANALHYIPHHLDFLSRCKTHLKVAGKMIIVEYDTNRSNPWVPFPVPYEQLRTIAIQIGVGVKRLKEQPSRFGGFLYSGMLLF